MKFFKAKRSKAPRSNLIRLLAYLRPYWIIYTATISCGIIKFLVPIAVIWLFGEAVDIFSNYQGGELSSDEAWRSLKMLALLGAGIVTLSPLPTFMRSLFGAKANTNVIKDIRCDLYAHIQKLSHSFYDRNLSGSLTSKIINDVEMITPFLGRTVVQLWMNLGMIVAVLGYLFWRNIYLGLLSVSLIPVQLVILLTVGRKIRNIAGQIREKLAYLSGNTQEVLSAATEVKTFTQERDEIQRFHDDSVTLVSMGVKNALLGGLSQSATVILNQAAALLVIIVGGWLAIFSPETLSVGLIVQFVMMQGQLYSPIERLSDTQVITAQALGAIDRIFEIFDTEPEIQDDPEAVRAQDIEGDILFENVVFRYPAESSQPILQEFNLHIPAHKSLALVGSSGGGKSTVGRLLNRFYDIESGRITIDGREIQSYKIRSLRKKIGLVPQDPILFTGTVLDNILYGDPEASIEAAYEAARNANALDFINEFPLGMNTRIGEGGSTLSGGQKQRVAIARAFLKDPAILILDEATSALDADSERKVQASLDKLMLGRTTIIIAHRLSTVRKADCIAVIDSGKVVEIGPHRELMELNGLYANLCRHQVVQ